MKEWVENELYAELMNMPIWTLAAFGMLKEGDVLSPNDIRRELLTILIANHMEKVPSHIYDCKYRHEWKVIDFIECVKSAIKNLKQIDKKMKEYEQ